MSPDNGRNRAPQILGRGLALGAACLDQRLQVHPCSVRQHRSSSHQEEQNARNHNRFKREQALAPPEWRARYDRRTEDMRLPETGPKREAYVAQVGADGYRLLKALEGANAPPDAAALPTVAVLRRVWAGHFERNEAGPDNGETGGDGVRLRPVQGRGPGDRIESPYDTDARFRSKAGMSWTGDMVHLTETCDEDAPRLVVHTDTTAANVHEARV